MGKWICKECGAELIAVYDIVKSNFWGKVDKNLNLIELDDTEDRYAEDRVIKKFICDCSIEITSEEEFKERAKWINGGEE